MNLKLVCTTAAFAATMLFSGYAQKGSAFFGPKVGMNIAFMTNSDNADARVGVQAGLQGQYFVTDKFALGAEVLYSQQGAKEKAEPISATMKLDYINIPLLAKFYPINNGFNVYAGPQFGFCVNSKAKGKGYGVTAEVDMSDYTKVFDFGIAMGVGYDFKFGLTTDVRWTPGITYVGKSSHYDNDENSRNSVISIAVGWKF